MKDIPLFTIQAGRAVFDPKELPGQLSQGLEQLKKSWETLDKSKMRPWEVTIVDAAFAPQNLKLKLSHGLVDRTQDEGWWCHQINPNGGLSLRLEVRAPIDAVALRHPEQRIRLMLVTLGYHPKNETPSPEDVRNKIKEGQLPEELADLVFAPGNLNLGLSWEPLPYDRHWNRNRSPLEDAPVARAPRYYVDFSLEWLREDQTQPDIPDSRRTWIRTPRITAEEGSTGYQLARQESYREQFKRLYPR